jgi:hypothetical protein
MGRPSTYPRELRECAVRMVAETRGQYPSEFAAIGSVARKLGIGSAETLRKWVRQDHRGGSDRCGAGAFRPNPLSLASRPGICRGCRVTGSAVCARVLPGLWRCGCLA